MFWDTSAVIPLVIQEASSATLRPIAASAKDQAMWWLTEVECCSALFRRYRNREFTEPVLRLALERLKDVQNGSDVIQPHESVRRKAVRLTQAYVLRGADAVQLAAALEWCGGNSTGQSFVCLDRRLREAATREGFTVLP